MARCCPQCVGGCRFSLNSLDPGVQIELFGSKEWKAASKRVDDADRDLENGKITLQEFRVIDCQNRKKMFEVAKRIDRMMS